MQHWTITKCLSKRYLELYTWILQCVCLISLIWNIKERKSLAEDALQIKISSETLFGLQQGVGY